MPRVSIRKNAFPTAWAALSGLPAPSSRENREALPMPMSSAMARQMVVRGKATLVAAFPRYPTPWPIKI